MVYYVHSKYFNPAYVYCEFKIYYHERMAGGSTMASMATAVADITIILDLVTR